MDLYSVRQSLNLGIPITNLKLRVTDYARVSTDNIKQKNSLNNQIEHFEEMIKNNQNWTYVEGYIDEGITGTSDIKRENFMKMIEDAKKGKFDLIITKEISRFSRNTLDSIKYTRELLQYGVAVLFVNDNINTILPDSELRLTIMASMAQDEIRRLSERVKFGMNRAIINGHILGNNKLYGYNKINGKLTINEPEATIIRKIYDMYVIKNMSLSKIVKYLNDSNTTTSMNNKFSVSTLSRMIKNPKYKGFYCGKKTEIIDYMTKKVKYYKKEDWITYEDNLKIPPIISPEIWNLAISKLEKRSKKFIKNNKTTYINKYPLSNKLICANDQSIFYRRKISKNNNDIAWWCSNYLKKGKYCCTTPMVREKEIYYILNDLINYLNININNINKLLINTYSKNFSNINNLNSETKKKEKLILKKNKLIELYTTNNISQEEFIEKNNQYNNQISTINNIINNLTKEKSNIDLFLHNIEKKLQEKTKKYIFKDYLISLILNKIIISSNNKSNIILKIYLNNSNKNELTKHKCFLIKYYSFHRINNKKEKKIKYKIFCYK